MPAASVLLVKKSHFFYFYCGFVDGMCYISEREVNSPGTVIREPEQLDYLEARWWPCGGYTLRSRKLQGDVWRFDVPD